MKIEMNEVEKVSIEKFAEKHNLVMEVHERSSGAQNKYYAHFKHGEIKEGSILCGSYGNGCSPEEAINNYGKEISEKILVIDAYKDTRKEIIVPVIEKSH